MAEVAVSICMPCSICRESKELRVLLCNHAFCMECLEILRELHTVKIICPIELTIDRTELPDLSICNNSQTLAVTPFEENHTNFSKLLALHIRTVNELLIWRLHKILRSHRRRISGLKFIGSFGSIALVSLKIFLLRLVPPRSTAVVSFAVFMQPLLL